MLSGLADTISSARYSETSGGTITNVLSSMAQSYAGQYYPTFAGQIARTIDPVRRTSSTDKTDSIPDSLGIEYFIRRNMNRMPGLSQKNEPYIDAWGRRDENGNLLLRAGENFILPGYVSFKKTSPMEQELARLYDITGDSAVLPTTPKKYFTVNGARYDLNNRQYTLYATERGKMQYDLLTKAYSSAVYKTLDDETRVKAAAKIYDYANQQATHKTNYNYYRDSWVTKAEGNAREMNLSLPEYLMVYAQWGGSQLPDAATYKIYKNHKIDYDVYSKYTDFIDTGYKGESFKSYDKDGSPNSLSNDELTAALKAMPGLSSMQKAVLWQVKTYSKSAKKNQGANNPFDTKVGKSVWDSLRGG